MLKDQIKSGGLQGFDPEFVDVPDFCRKITHRIWEERGVDRIREYYEEVTPVRSPVGRSETAEDVIRASLERLYTFPDRQILDEDVISSEDLPGTFYSSHRVLSVANHTGGGALGEPTGKTIRVRGMADCIYKQNKIQEEWLVRDNAGVVTQLGGDPRLHAQNLAEADFQAGKTPPTAEDFIDRWSGGPQAAPISGAVEIYSETLRRIFERAEIRLLRSQYDQSCSMYGPNNEVFSGYQQLDRFFFGYLASFPHGKFRLHHWVERRDPGHPVRVAIRWSLEAKHAGHGRFGPPSGAEVVLLGISHAEIWGDRVMREYHVLDEISIWKQIADHRLKSRNPA